MAMMRAMMMRSFSRQWNSTSSFHTPIGTAGRIATSNRIARWPANINTYALSAAAPLQNMPFPNQHNRFSTERKEEARKEMWTKPGGSGPLNQVLDENSWIWTIKRADLLAMTYEELTQFCQDKNIHFDYPSKYPRKLIRGILKYKRWEQQKFPKYLKVLKEKGKLDTREQIEFYDNHTTEELKQMMHKYGIIPDQKNTKDKMVRRILKKQQKMSHEEDTILRDHEHQLTQWGKDIGLPEAYQKRTPDYMMRRLDIVRQINLKIHNKLLQNAEKAITPLNPALHYPNVGEMSWKEQLHMFHPEDQIETLLAHAGLEPKGPGWLKYGKRFSILRKVCAKLGIKEPGQKKVWSDKKPRRKNGKTEGGEYSMRDDEEQG